MNESLLIREARVLQEQGILENGWVYVEDGTIRSVGTNPGSAKRHSSSGRSGGTGDPPEADRVIDAQGHILSPGFIDVHTHGVGRVDYVDGDVESMKEGFGLYAAYGVTRFQPTTLAREIDNIMEQVRKIARAKEESDLGAMVHGVHVEGPWLAERCRGGHAAKYLRAPEEREIGRLLDEVGEHITHCTFAPELENTVWFAEELASRDIVAAMGHSEASFEATENAILAGARHVTHMYDAMLGFQENPDEALTRLPGLETAVQLHDDVSIELIGCPIHVPKPFFRLIDKMKPRDKKIVVTDSLMGGGLPEHTVLTQKDGREIYVEQGVLRMIDEDPYFHGNLTGSAVTMNLAIRRLAEYAQLPVWEAVRWGSINPAVLLGIDRYTGSIRPGKDADLVLMTEDYDVRMTFLQGRITYQHQDF